MKETIAEKARSSGHALNETDVQKAFQGYSKPTVSSSLSGEGKVLESATQEGFSPSFEKDLDQRVSALRQQSTDQIGNASFHQGKERILKQYDHHSKDFDQKRDRGIIHRSGDLIVDAFKDEGEKVARHAKASGQKVLDEWLGEKKDQPSSSWEESGYFPFTRKTSSSGDRSASGMPPLPRKIVQP
jgi:CRISPR/Cas system-associated protein Cas10 (large subunit of type III CRISPR-Cas system)